MQKWNDVEQALINTVEAGTKTLKDPHEILRIIYLGTKVVTSIETREPLVIQTMFRVVSRGVKDNVIVIRFHDVYELKHLKKNKRWYKLHISRKATKKEIAALV